MGLCVRACVVGGFVHRESVSVCARLFAVYSWCLGYVGGRVGVFVLLACLPLGNGV